MQKCATVRGEEGWFDTSEIKVSNGEELGERDKT